MRVAVTGGRDFEDRDLLWSALDDIHGQSPISLIIEGGQRKWCKERKRVVGGADFWAFKWGKSRGVDVQTVEADWKLLGRAAGPKRNGDMVRIWRPHLVVATPGGNGTADMMGKSILAGLRVVKL